MAAKEYWEMTLRITRQRADAPSPDLPASAAHQRQTSPLIRAAVWLVLATVSGLIGWAVTETLR